MKRATIFGLVAVAFFLGSALSPEVASAQDETEQVEALFAEGAALYKARRYQAAIVKFEAAYALYPEPNLLYNMGRAYEALGELDIAIKRYKACARTVDVSLQVRKKALDKASVLSRAVASSRAVPSSKSPPDAATGEDDDVALAATAWTSAALSVGLLATGGVFLGLGLEDEQKAESQVGMAPLEIKNLDSRGAERKLVGGVLLGAGVVSGVLSIVLFAADSEDEGSHFSAVPLDDGAAVLFQGSF